MTLQFDSMQSLYHNILQSGPSDGKDKVKKGGSFMCHKVGVYYWYQIQFFL